MWVINHLLQCASLIAPYIGILINVRTGWAQSAHPVFLNFAFSTPVRRRVAQAGQGILTNMFEHVTA
jgi:hypothetical protein